MRFEEYDFCKAAVDLVIWYRQANRSLPWRKDRDPYHIWISEIMLQQTRAETVITYYKQFLESLPDLSSLADCEEEVFLKLWEGLGYYSRVRNLHKTAQLLMKEYGGRFPCTSKELELLPGIGSYTAGAIASIAFGEPVPAVDGNVLRVCMRLSADPSDIACEKTKQRLRDALKQSYQSPALSALYPGDLNQALMDLGALVCLPSGQADCRSCPLQTLCCAFADGKTNELPVKTPKKSRRIEKRTVLLIQDGSRTALRKRPSKGLLAGLWEFPNTEGHLTDDEVIRYVRSLGFSPLFTESLPEAVHVFSHVEWHMKGVRVRIAAAESETAGQTGRSAKEPNSKCIPPEGAQSSGTVAAGLLFATADELRTDFAIPSAFSVYRP